MFYDTALVNVFRAIINSRWYRFLAHTRLGVWTIKFFDFCMVYSSRRLRHQKHTVAELMLTKISHLENNVNELRKELDDLRQSIQKH